jgi:hypothetical protein
MRMVSLVYQQTMPRLMAGERTIKNHSEWRRASQVIDYFDKTLLWLGGIDAGL